MKVLDLMTRPAVATTPDARLLDVAETMLSLRVSALPVVDGDRLVGIITDGDLLRRWEAGTNRKYEGFAVVKVGIERIAGDFVRSHGAYVRELMTTNVLSVDEVAPLEDAIRLIERHGFKQLPVTRERKLTGILTRRSILVAFASNARRLSEGEHSDEDITRALFAMYTREPWAPLDRMNVLKDGVVEIIGDIGNESQRQAVVAGAEGIPGVKGVIDRMKCTPSMAPGPTRIKRSSGS